MITFIIVCITFIFLQMVKGQRYVGKNNKCTCLDERY